MYAGYIINTQKLTKTLVRVTFTNVTTCSYEEFRRLIREDILSGEIDKRKTTVKYFAGKMSTHPNHLNAVIKRRLKKTAIAFIHEQIVHESKSLLNQTELSVKEIAFRLGFYDSIAF